jgi:thiol-disulfide isomerase/thioredoxin
MALTILATVAIVWRALRTLAIASPRNRARAGCHFSAPLRILLGEDEQSEPGRADQMAGTGKRAQEQRESPVRRMRGRGGRRGEPVMWAAIFALVLTVQWPALKGWYYGETEAAAPASAIDWRSNLAGALAEARTAHKRVVVDFSASWCPPCVAMKHEVWPDADVARAVNAGYVPLMVDADQDHGVSSRYQVDGIPAILVLDPEGRVVKRHDGFLARDAMLKFLAPAPH